MGGAGRPRMVRRTIVIPALFPCPTTALPSPRSPAPIIALPLPTIALPAPLSPSPPRPPYPHPSHPAQAGHLLGASFKPQYAHLGGEAAMPADLGGRTALVYPLLEMRRVARSRLIQSHPILPPHPPALSARPIRPPHPPTLSARPIRPPHPESNPSRPARLPMP